MAPPEVTGEASAREKSPEIIPSHALPHANPSPVAPSLAPRLALNTGPLSWEQRIAAVTAARGMDDGAKARQLLDMLPTLPEEALGSATREAVERLPDKAYGAARERMINPQTHGMVLSVLFDDLLERPDEVALPVLLTIARTPAHPLAPQARDNLELLLGTNLGADWMKWDAEIRRTLASHR